MAQRPRTLTGGSVQGDSASQMGGRPRSMSNASSANESFGGTSYGAPFSGGAGGPSTGMTDADYRDTVLYLQRQQVLNHSELLEALRTLASRMDGGVRTAPSAGGDGIAPPTGTPPANRVFESDTTVGSSQRHADMLIRGVEPSAGTKLVTELSATESEVALRAAQSRIETLEAQVASLKSQVRQQDLTIQRLSDANLATVRTLSSSMTPTGGRGDTFIESDAAIRAAGSATPRRAVYGHQQSVDKLVAGIDLATGRSSAGVESPFASGIVASSPGSASVSTPAVRELLKEHQRQCQHVLLH